MTAFEHWILDNTGLWISVLIFGAFNMTLITITNLRKVWRNET